MVTKKQQRELLESSAFSANPFRKLEIGKLVLLATRFRTTLAAVNCLYAVFGKLGIPSADCAFMNMTFHGGCVFCLSGLERRIDLFAYDSMSAFLRGLDVIHSSLFCFLRLHNA